MKKSLFALLVALLCAGLFITSCAPKPEVVTPVEPVGPEQGEFVTPELTEPVEPVEPEPTPEAVDKKDNSSPWKTYATLAGVGAAVGVGAYTANKIMKDKEEKDDYYDKD